MKPVDRAVPVTEVSPFSNLALAKSRWDFRLCGFGQFLVRFFGFPTKILRFFGLVSCTVCAVFLQFSLWFAVCVNNSNGGFSDFSVQGSLQFFWFCQGS